MFLSLAFKALGLRWVYAFLLSHLHIPSCISPATSHINEIEVDQACFVLASINEMTNIKICLLFSVLGLEAKNMIHAAVESVTLHDQSNVEMWDLTSNFYFTDADIGKKWTVACCNKLQELNTAVTVSVTTESRISQHLPFFWASLLMPKFLGNDGIQVVMNSKFPCNCMRWC